jgi:hypothetical protein
MNNVTVIIAVDSTQKCLKLLTILTTIFFPETHYVECYIIFLQLLPYYLKQLLLCKNRAAGTKILNFK